MRPSYDDDWYLHMNFANVIQSHHKPRTLKIAPYTIAKLGTTPNTL